MILHKVLEAHGGLAHWQRFNTMYVTLKFGGLAFQSRFNRSGLLERRVDINTKKPHVVFHNFPSKGFTGFFEPNLVAIKRPNGTNLTRENPRAAFDSIRRNFYWDNLDLLYFAGYACWNYFNSPFLLSYDGVICEEIEPWICNGQLLKSLRVTFPDSIPTHCRNQTFYFDSNFHMTRLDYNPEIFAKWARAAHFCSHYLKWNGILIPSRRIVLPNGKDHIAASFPTLVWIRCSDIVLV